MNFERLIQNHGGDPNGVGSRIESDVVTGCWFEWLRQGGCGAGELTLDRNWAETADVSPGDWISIGTSETDRWYLGRVEEWRSEFPAGVTLRLGGMVNELNEVFVGGFGDDGVKPARFGATDVFSNDPDYALQSHVDRRNVVSVVEELYATSMSRQTHVAGKLEIAAAENATVDSLTLRGEESVRSLMKDLAVRAGGVAWGIDEWGMFFFRPDPETVAATHRLHDDVTRFATTRSRDVLFNRLQITGDYVYDRRVESGAIARRSYRYRKIFGRDVSGATYGEHRIRLWLPWVRTDDDATRFASRFFDQYASPVASHLVEVVGSAGLRAMPWLGHVVVLDDDDAVVTAGVPAAVRVRFDGRPVIRLELGPEDPRRLWPEPPQDERYEIRDVESRSVRVASSDDSSSSWSSFDGPSGGPPGGPGSPTDSSPNDSTGLASSWVSDVSTMLSGGSDRSSAASSASDNASVWWSSGSGGSESHDSESQVSDFSGTDSYDSVRSVGGSSDDAASAWSSLAGSTVSNDGPSASSDVFSSVASGESSAGDSGSPPSGWPTSLSGDGQSSPHSAGHSYSGPGNGSELGFPTSHDDPVTGSMGSAWESSIVIPTSFSSDELSSSSLPVTPNPWSSLTSYGSSAFSSS